LCIDLIGNSGGGGGGGGGAGGGDGADTGAGAGSGTSSAAAGWSPVGRGVAVARDVRDGVAVSIAPFAVVSASISRFRAPVAAPTPRVLRKSAKQTTKATLRAHVRPWNIVGNGASIDTDSLNEACRALLRRIFLAVTDAESHFYQYRDGTVPRRRAVD
jgi:hypothetical protein